MKALTVLPLAAVILLGVTGIANGRGGGGGHGSPMTGTTSRPGTDMGNTGGTSGPAATSGSGLPNANASNDETQGEPRPGIGPDASRIASPPSIMAPVSSGRR